MNKKLADKEKAIKLRKTGYSYSEILEKIHVSKSSLSEWLRHVKITNKQVERLRLKNEKARKLGSVSLFKKRISKTNQIIKFAKDEITDLNEEHLKVIGAALYWAEGSKQTINRPSKELIFTNSDPKMIKVYLLWIDKCLKITKKNIKFEIYIHRSYKLKDSDLIKFWSNVTGFSKKFFNKIYYKNNKVKSYRKNRGANYNGVLRITVRKSTDINRKVMGWVEGICDDLNSVT